MAERKKEYKITDHQLFISPLLLWIKLRRQNKVAKGRRWMAFKITLFVLISSPFRGIQRLYLRRKLRSVDPNKKPPVFVIGHWRSGTTHLHYLLWQDKQFVCLDAFQAFFFNIAFVSKTIVKPILNAFMPSTRPQDNVKTDANSPQEEEHPLTNRTYMSGMHAFFFPKNLTYLTKWNLFENVTESEVKEWKKTYSDLLKKILLFQDPKKRLLLKNPHNTGRIKVLSEMFPKAKFIFIHRNPYEVYSSTRVLYAKTVSTQFLQDFSDKEIEDRILISYEKTLTRYLELRGLIPKNQIIEVAYADLDNKPLEELKRMYEHLDLGDFNSVLPLFQKYLEGVKNFKKNKPVAISERILQRIQTDWKFAFDEWGYQMNEVKSS